MMLHQSQPRSKFLTIGIAVGITSLSLILIGLLSVFLFFYITRPNEMDITIAEEITLTHNQPIVIGNSFGVTGAVTNTHRRQVRNMTLTVTLFDQNGVPITSTLISMPGTIASGETWHFVETNILVMSVTLPTSAAITRIDIIQIF